ncbi:Glycosyltransferase involved in cell wall bisynthesis [Succiniclasticum ruminis]|uniref:Glycosyltransferase involved in cell wall bisynthesis n=1 Tax=Succiniclasticum ruminis TaxID=40841 RepID=A0A1G6I3Y9_9FIRM|nr:Glycosyltransferase involved in cell wall bisynthesis [Succiniclasticum ruminis]
MYIVDKQIAVLVPCYNEEQTIYEVVSAFKRVLSDAIVYVYDNNSTDQTAVIAKQAGAIVRHEYRQGKGNVVRSMFRDIKADCYVMVDGDNTYPADVVKEMCRLILEGKADMVIGDRLSSTYFSENKRRFHNFGNDMVRRVINFLWKPKEPIFDVMTGLRVFSPLFVKSFPVLSQGFEVETEMTIHALDNNLLIRSIPVMYRDRPEGSQSKLKTYSDGAKVLLTIFNLFRDYKPLKFFGTLAVLLATVSLILFLPVFSEFLHTGLVPRFPTLIVSVVMMLAAFLSVVCGLILDTNAKNNRKNFEIQMNILKLLLKKRV